MLEISAAQTAMTMYIYTHCNYTHCSSHLYGVTPDRLNFQAVTE